MVISMSLGEFLKAESDQEKQWRLTKRIGCAEYDAETNVIKLHVYKGNSVYEVDLDRCTTPGELLDWMFHLVDKNWCAGTAVLNDFVLCLQFAIRETKGRSLYDYYNVHEQA